MPIIIITASSTMSHITSGDHSHVSTTTTTIPPTPEYLCSITSTTADQAAVSTTAGPTTTIAHIPLDTYRGHIDPRYGLMVNGRAAKQILAAYGYGYVSLPQLRRSGLLHFTVVNVAPLYPVTAVYRCIRQLQQQQSIPVSSPPK